MHLTIKGLSPFKTSAIMMTPYEYTDQLEVILVEEFGESRDNAQRMIRKYTDIVIRGVMAMALQMRDSSRLQEELC
jgi:hypothetical protein